ncbi:hypothetical protein [Methanomethylovorans sp. PtaU1.Bin093]|uniref:hypothetical protein n=1 Tax=Methanomethylovorans sp. PtaU1.Bin093 TaxID=1811679 RepID=UPI00345BBBE6
MDLTEDEIAFYYVLETNDSAVKVIPFGLLQGNLLNRSRECSYTDACKAYPALPASRRRPLKPC